MVVLFDGGFSLRFVVSCGGWYNTGTCGLGGLRVWLLAVGLVGLGLVDSGLCVGFWVWVVGGDAVRW